MLVPPKSIARRRLQETCHGSMEIALSSLQRLFFCHLILMSSSIFHINSMHLCSHFVSLHFGGSETEGLNPCSSNTAIGRSRPTYKSPKPNWYNPSNPHRPGGEPRNFVWKMQNLKDSFKSQRKIPPMWSFDVICSKSHTYYTMIYYDLYCLYYPFTVMYSDKFWGWFSLLGLPHWLHLAWQT